jgi:hypothetical protein
MVYRILFVFGLIASGIFGLTTVFELTALAQPTVQISPVCGPAEPGFNIVINANGFKPNSTVAYKFVGSDSKIPLYGYFQSNSTGGFNDVTFADDLKNDHYKLYLADDANDDGIFDIGAKRVYQNVTIPCEYDSQMAPSNSSGSE